jgi:hypothetical protein
MASIFDPAMYMDSQTTDQGSTERVYLTPTKLFMAVIEKAETRKWVKKDDPSVQGLALDVTFNIDDADEKARLGRTKLTVTQGLMIDLTDSTPPAIDYSKGKNVDLNRLRDAVGLNTPGQPFSFRMLVGRPVRVMVSHKPSDRPGAQPGDMYENVTAYAKAA